MAYLLALSAGIHPAPGHAQSALPDPSPELQRQERQRSELRQQMEAQPWTPSAGIAATPPHQRLPEEQPCARIERIEIEGNPLTPALHTALDGVQADDPPLGRCLGSQGITLLIQRLQQALVEQGYITSQAHVPEQDLRTGTLVFRILEGRVAQIRPATDDQSLPRLAWSTGAGDILNLRDIEQSSENLRRLPSLNPQLQIEPGEAPGTSDVVVDLSPRRPIRLGLAVDDGGNRTTGKLQGNLTLSWDNPLGLADLFYFTRGQDLGDRDAGPRGSHNQIVHYSLPWGYWLLGATWSDNRYHQRVFGPYESYRYSGTSSQKELALSRVLHRDGNSKTAATLKGFWRQSNNYIADLEVIVQRRRTEGGELSLQHLRHTAFGTLQLQWVHRQGRDAWGDPDLPNTYGHQPLRLDQAHVNWSLPLTEGAAAWIYNTQIQVQWARSPLSPQDRLCLGGRYSVRGFDGQQTLCGDQGQLWRNELAATLPAIISPLPETQAYLALDAGRAITPGQDDAYRLSGLALGLRGYHKVSDAYPLQWDLFVGRPLSRPEGFTTSRRTAGFSLRAEF